jgi:hypothetical protein
MADRRVTHTGKDSEGDITGLCDPSAGWYSRLTADAIADIESGAHTYYVEGASGRTDIHVVDGPTVKYLRTDPNQIGADNLDDLPDCSPLRQVLSSDVPIKLLWEADSTSTDLASVESRLAGFADRLYDCTDGQWRVGRFLIHDDRSELSSKGRGVGHVHRTGTHGAHGHADGRPNNPEHWEVNETSSVGAYLMEFLHSWTGLKDEYEVSQGGASTNCPAATADRDSSKACVMDDTYGSPSELCRPDTHNTNTEQGNVRGMDCYSWLVKVMDDAGNHGFQVPSRHVLGPATAPTLRFVYLTIENVRQIDDPDPGWFQGPGDYYAKVRMSGAGFAKSKHRDNRSNVSPDWLFGLAFSSDADRRIPIRLQIWDHDFWSSDDLCDMSPVAGKKHLDLVYDTATGGISGDVNGQRDVPITVSGSGDSDRVETTFVITSR